MPESRDIETNGIERGRASSPDWSRRTKNAKLLALPALETEASSNGLRPRSE